MASAIKGFFGRQKKSLNEMLIKSICELGKYYSRLELALSKLAKRERDLFGACILSLSKGMQSRAAIYANEVAELRKLMSAIQGIQLSIERAILRLETFKAVTPTLQDIKGVFSEVKGTLSSLAKVMPSLTPELNNFMNSINELLVTTEISPVKCEPVIVGNEATEAILKEALDHLKSEVERKIPEPPEGAPVSEQPKAAAIKPRIALTVDGAEVYVGEDGSIIGTRNSGQSRLMEELILDYIERNRGELNISKCAKELNMPPDKIMEIIESLNRKGIIRVE
ncbi:MAG: hypothetical protein QXR13_02035 [Candidatus Bathyarchaeia archaeon]